MSTRLRESVRRRMAWRFRSTAVGFSAGLVVLLVGCSGASAAGPPSIESESASKITSTDATLEAQINPGDAPDGIYYQFQLVGDPAEYESEITCPSEPVSGSTRPCVGARSLGSLPIGFIPGGSAPEAVGVDLGSALEPGMTYHYRVLVAKAVPTEDTVQWEAPALAGDDRTFSTPGLPVSQPPAIVPVPQAGEGIGTAALYPSRGRLPRHHHRRHKRHRQRGLHQGALSSSSAVG